MSDVALRFGATDDGTLSAQFRKITGSLDSLEKNVSKTSSLISSGFKALGAAAAAVSIVRLASEALEYAESIKVASDRTGIAVDQIQRLQFIAEQADVSFESVTGSVNKFQKNLTEGSTQTTATLKRLGLSITELNSLNPDEQFLRIGSAIAAIQSPAERAAAAINLFGRGGTELLPLLNLGAAGVQQLSASFDELGISISGDALAKVNEAGDALDRLKSSVKGLGVELLSLAAPALEKAADGVTLFLKSLRFVGKGGEGDNEIVNLSDQIGRLRARAESFRAGQSTTDLRKFQSLIREADALSSRLDLLLGVGSSGIDPLKQIGVDVDSVQVSKTAQAGIRRVLADLREPTVQERRDQTQVANTQNVQIAVDEKSLITEINQEKLDELLRQETAHSDAMRTIDGDLARFRKQIRETFGTEEISFEAAKNASIIDIAGSLFGALARENSKLAKIQQAIALAEAIWATAAGVSKALSSVPYPANLAAAAKVAALGAIQIAKIKATNYNGGGSGGGSSAGGSGASASAGVAQLPENTERSTPQKITQIYLNGWINNDMRKELLDVLRDEDRRGVVIFNSRGNQASEIRRGA